MGVVVAQEDRSKMLKAGRIFDIFLEMQGVDVRLSRADGCAVKYLDLSNQ